MNQGGDGEAGEWADLTVLVLHLSSNLSLGVGKHLKRKKYSRFGKGPSAEGREGVPGFTWRSKRGSRRRKNIQEAKKKKGRSANGRGYRKTPPPGGEKRICWIARANAGGLYVRNEAIRAGSNFGRTRFQRGSRPDQAIGKTELFGDDWFCALRRSKKGGSIIPSGKTHTGLLIQARVMEISQAGRGRGGSKEKRKSNLRA